MLDVHVKQGSTRREKDIQFSQTQVKDGIVLTAAIFITVVPTVIVSITLPLSRDARAFTKSTDSTGKMITSTGTLSATCNTCKERKKIKRCFEEIPSILV